MNVSLPDKLMYHAYIIQAVALASEEHYLSRQWQGWLQREYNGGGGNGNRED
jgi:hypothetical protein